MTATTELVRANEPAEPSLLKTDVLGRVRHSAQQRERLLDEFARSGISGPKFAALAGVKYQTFASWVQARKRRRHAYPKRQPPGKTPAPVKWLEAVVAPPSAQSGPGLVLHLPGGVRAEITSAQHIAWAAALVRAIEPPC